MPRVVDHDERREEILARCVDLFASHGYAALPMRRIAAELGVSTGTLYHYFESKTALFRAMMKWLVVRDVAAASAAVTPEMGAEVRYGVLVAFVESNVDALQKALRIALDFDRQSADPADQSILAETLAGYRKALQDQLGLGSAGEATLLVSVVLGALVQRMWEPAAIDVGAHLRRLGAVVAG